MPELTLVHKDGKHPENWCKIEAKANNKGVTKVYIYDEIGLWGTSASDFAEELKDLDTSQIELHLNSPGGALFDGIAIMNTLRYHEAAVTVYVDGLAASAASLIAMAGDRIVMRPGSQMMIHEARGIAMGDASVMLKMAETLEHAGDNAASVYAGRAGGPKEYWRDAMKNETWYSPEEAVEAGLADEASKTKKEEGNKDEPENNWDLTVFMYAGRDAAPAPNLDKQKEQQMPAPKFKLNGVETEDYAAVQAALDKPPAVHVEEKPVVMKINGADTRDAKAVQAHIDGLETFQKETLENARKGFVKNLAEKNLILASTVEAMEAFALSLSAEQYDAWTATFKNAVAHPALQQQAGGITNADGEDSSSTERTKRIDILEDIVANHRRGGLTDEEIKNTASYKELQQLKSSQS